MLGQKTGIEPYALPVRNHPTSEAFDTRPVEGFSLLVGEADNPDKCLPCTSKMAWSQSAFDEGTSQEFTTLQNGIYGFYCIGNDKRDAWTKWFESDCPMTGDVEEYIINHAFHKPLEAEFSHDKYLEHSAMREEPVSEELTDKDWVSMACAVTTDSVACRFNPHPHPPCFFSQMDPDK